MKAFTVYPEWGYAFTCMDKGVENRTWKPFDSVIGKRIAIHAGSRIGGSDGWKKDPLTRVAECALQAGWRIDRFYNGKKTICFDLEKDDKIVSLKPELIVKKAIVAVATITGYDEPTDIDVPPWGMSGYYRWHMNDIQALQTPILIDGFQGFWNVPGPIVEQINAQLEMKKNTPVNDYVYGMPKVCTRCGNPPTKRDNGKLTPWGKDSIEWLCENCILLPDEYYKEWARQQAYAMSFTGSSIVEIESFAETEPLSLSTAERDKIIKTCGKRQDKKWKMLFGKEAPWF